MSALAQDGGAEIPLRLRTATSGEEVVAKLYIDSDKYGGQGASAVVDAYHGAIKELIRRRLDEVGGDWASFVFDKSYELIGAKDFAAVEKKLLATGHRFDWSAMISVRERPDAYKARHRRRRGPEEFQLRASRGGRCAEGRRMVASSAASATMS